MVPADFTGFTDEFAAFDVNVGVASAVHLEALLWAEWVS
jgi:hypothetical protein